MGKDLLEWKLVSPSKYKGKSLMDMLDKVKWTEKLQRKFEKVVNRGRHLARCDMSSVLYPVSTITIIMTCVLYYRFLIFQKHSWQTGASHGMSAGHSDLRVLKHGKCLVLPKGVGL